MVYADNISKENKFIFVCTINYSTEIRLIWDRSQYKDHEFISRLLKL